MAVSWDFGREVRAPAPAAAVVAGTVTDMEKTDLVYDDENIRDEGEQWDDEERDRE
ncbi:hypothetical protein [Mycobacteroides abscessus]|uniref:hypothetical protein n=1 Tax=Mycobacteroides abscessus TaxID=36809 RepID=UPI0013001595|nr:hypothetical protein [Mycobacteroides abscessus]